ncbi:non-homologous end joining protein Ku [Streptomyces sp. DW26H14]|uniref:non-homologous end joining protein Ku n=1 Tax=Streptomyces sp. DW26H14 TaxID=3435395 RepID=UPI00403DE585
MPRPIWTGAVSFGLVTIPIRITGASENRAVRFHRIHLEDGGRVRNQKRCELDDEVVTDDDIGKGYELGKDQIVPVTDEELDAIPLPTARTVEIIAFMDRDAIDPVRLGQSFYLEASGEAAAKPYVLLRRALERSGQVAVTKLALRGRERLAVLDIRGDALTLHTMHWPDEVRSPVELAPRPVELSEDEIAQAMSLIDGMTTDDLSGFHDEYRHAVEELLAAKAEGREPQKAEDGEEPGRVVDLMAALEQSVEKARASRGESDGDGDATVHELPRKRAGGGRKAADGASAAKSSARESTGKKTAARKTAESKPARKKASGGSSGAGRSASAKSRPEQSAAEKSTSAGGGTAKTAAGSSGGRKATAKKTASKKTAAGSDATSGERASQAEKATPKKESARKSPAKKTASGKTAAKKSTANKTASKKSAAKKATPGKSSPPRRAAS